MQQRVKPLIVGITGYAGSGKDYTASVLSKKLSQNGYKCETLHLADSIKDTVNKLFGWDERHSTGDLKEAVDKDFGFSPRKAYQLFGTEFGRALSEDIWVHVTAKRIEAMDDVNVVFIPDVRFFNECQFVKNEGGLIISVTSESHDYTGHLHSSESFIKELREVADYNIINDKGSEFDNHIEKVSILIESDVNAIKTHQDTVRQIDWSDIPKTVAYVAKDADGGVFGYEKQPRRASSYWVSTCDTCYSLNYTKVADSLSSVPWKMSCAKRTVDGEV